MNRITVSGLIMLLLMTALASCTGPADRDPASGNAQTAPAGIWYEQNEYGDTLEITEDKIVCTSWDGGYTFEEYCSFKEQDSVVLIEPEDEYFIYEDMYYDPVQDIIVAYTMSHMDGDGGHHYLEFHRTAYEAPPAPVYPPPEDHSDPDAKKEFEDLTIRRMQVSFYDEGMPYDSSWDVAMEPPFADEYSYDLEVLEDGTGLVSSSFCQEIELPAETISELQELARLADLGQINGVDIHTEGLPYGTPWYEAEIELASGEIIRSSANGENVPESWAAFQKPMHHLLFFAFMDAGYQYGTGEFHSTKPMKRLQASDRTYREETGLNVDTVYIVPDWEKSFDYSLDSHYFTFTDPQDRYPVLMETLDALSLQYEEIAQAQLLEDYEMMEAVPESVWKNANRRYCYSLYAVDHWELNNQMFDLMVSTGTANSLGVGEAGYGQYGYVRYCIDTDSGQILSLSDLFISDEAIASFITDKMVSSYGTHSEEGRRVHAEDFPAVVAEAVKHSEPEGIGWTIDYNRVTLWMPLDMFPSSDSQSSLVIYYDEIQDILNDTYTEVW